MLKNGQDFPASWLRLLVLCLSLMACIIPVSVEAAPQTVTLQLEQWNALKANTNLLEAKLNLASEKLQQQKSTSTELLTQLTEAKTQLQETQQALTNSKRSLKNVKESLKRSEELYETLIEQMEYDRQRTLRIKRQRNVYAGSAVFFLVCFLAK